MTTFDLHALGVGPVLQSTPFAHVIAAAIVTDNDLATVTDRGGYLLVLAPRICRLSRATVEAATGSPVRFPGDLEMTLSSFTGRMRLTEQDAVWWLAGDGAPDPPAPKASDAVR